MRLRHSQCLARLLTLVLISIASVVLAGDLGPVIPKGVGEQCVAETGFMRRNHMDLIVHQRDETVIKGIRDEPFSLVECVDCHVQRDTNDVPIRVDAEGQFCSSCHEYVAAKIDCFGCHAAVPDATADNRVGDMHWLKDESLLALSLRNFKNLNTDEGEGHHADRISPKSE